ncbi:MAG: hypothetical protein AB7R89_01460 [Dehalococcoidia bacterium]
MADPRASRLGPGRVWFLVVWLVAAVVLGGALLAAQLDVNPLDDPDLAHQRPGFLNALGPPFPAAPVVESIPQPGRRAVVFFTRPGLAERLFDALEEASSLRERAAVAVVVSGEPPPGVEVGVPVVVDPSGRLAAEYRMPVPRDGGPPVGYAIVDSDGLVRYRTLDPHMEDRLGDEVVTMVKATP